MDNLGTPSDDRFTIVQTVATSNSYGYWYGSFDGLGGTNTLEFSNGWGSEIYILDVATGEGRDYLAYGLDVLVIFQNIQNITVSTNMTVKGDDGRNVIIDTSNASANRFWGRGGNDEIWAGGGNDRAFGDDGDDVLHGQTGSDVLYGNAGDDVLHGEADNDVLYGNDGDDRLVGGLGMDSLYGDSGKDLLYGSDGADTLSGGDGNDTLNGGTGIDRMYGGLGNDTYYVDETTDLITEALGDGADRVFSAANYTLSANVESLTLIGTQGITGTGNSLNNVLTGNGSANIINGLSGNDKLNGAAGRDALTGGAGADQFIFNAILYATRNVDTIGDFNRVEGDKIVLENSVFKAFATIAGNTSPSATAFYSAAGAVSAMDTSDRLIYNTTTGALYYDADGTGVVAPVLFAILGTNTHPTITHTDFLVI